VSAPEDQDVEVVARVRAVVRCEDACGWPAAPSPCLDVLKGTAHRLCVVCWYVRRTKSRQAS
jgi:hypothetical protein